MTAVPLADPRPAVSIRREFVDLDFGQVHVRRAGDGQGRALVMIHASPGSSRQLEPLMQLMATDRQVIAPDTLGFGDSAPHPASLPEIADYAAYLVRTLEAMEVNSFDLYGSHTGACVAAEVALAVPDRVKSLVLDGVGDFDPEFRERLLANYAEPFTPDQDGAYLIRAFQFCRDQALFWPWFDRTRHARRDGGLLPVERLHAWVVEVLKAATTYHLGYRAAFSWDAADRLKDVRVRTLMVAAADDPLFEDTQALALRSSGVVFANLPHSAAPDSAAVKAKTLRDFFEGGD